MDPLRLRRRENEAVLAYLETEQLPSWRESTSPWVVDGYALSTHPDLCERVEALAGAAGGRFGYVYGRPAVATEDGVMVAFAAGTHIFCLRLPSDEWTRVDPWSAETAAALAAALRRSAS